MNFRPYLQFYKSIFPFIIVFALIGIAFAGLLYGFLMFLTLGIGFGFFGFNVFYKEQWYVFQNLGITKWRLLKMSFFINFILGTPVFAVLFILTSFILGDFSLT